MNNHVIDYLKTKGSFLTNLYILDEISTHTYMGELDKYNQKMKQECDLLLEFQIKLGNCVDYEPLFDGVRVERE